MDDQFANDVMTMKLPIRWLVMALFVLAALAAGGDIGIWCTGDEAAGSSSGMAPCAAMMEDCYDCETCPGPVIAVATPIRLDHPVIMAASAFTSPPATLAPWSSRGFSGADPPRAIGIQTSGLTAGSDTYRRTLRIRL